MNQTDDGKPKMETCRNCRLPIREVPADWPNVGTHWVHANTNQFPCRDSEGLMTLDQAEPESGQ